MNVTRPGPTHLDDNLVISSAFAQVPFLELDSILLLVFEGLYRNKTLNATNRIEVRRCSHTSIAARAQNGREQWREWEARGDRRRWIGGWSRYCGGRWRPSLPPRKPLHALRWKRTLSLSRDFIAYFSAFAFLFFFFSSFSVFSVSVFVFAQLLFRLLFPVHRLFLWLLRVSWNPL